MPYLQLVILLQQIECSGQASDVDFEKMSKSDLICVPHRFTGKLFALLEFYNGKIYISHPSWQACIHAILKQWFWKCIPWPNRFLRCRIKWPGHRGVWSGWLSLHRTPIWHLFPSLSAPTYHYRLWALQVSWISQPNKKTQSTEFQIDQIQLLYTLNSEHIKLSPPKITFLPLCHP